MSKVLSLLDAGLVLCESCDHYATPASCPECENSVCQGCHDAYGCDCECCGNYEN